MDVQASGGGATFATIVSNDARLVSELSSALSSSGVSAQAAVEVDPRAFRLGAGARHVAVLDIDLHCTAPGSCRGGCEVIVAARKADPEARIVALTTGAGPEIEHRLALLGVWAVVERAGLEAGQVAEAVVRVARGAEREVRLEATSPSATRLSERELFTRLSPREAQVLALVARGSDNLKISAILGIKERTARAHVSNLYRKLQVENRSELVLFGLRALSRATA